MSYVLVSTVLGVFLGEGEGLHAPILFWSNDSPVVDEAPCYETPAHIDLLISKWGPLSLPFAESLTCARVVPDISVEGDEVQYASVRACMAAGLPGWVTSHTAPVSQDSYGERPRIH